MIIFLIAILWFISISLRITYSGISSLEKINKKINENKSDDNSDKKNINAVGSTVSQVSVQGLKTVRRIVDIFRYLLSAILPIVLILDVVVFGLFVATASGYLLLFGS